MRGTPLQKPQRQTKVRVDHQIAVARRGFRDRAEMDDALELAAFEPAKQIHRRNKIGELVLLQVAPLAVFAERVVHHNIAAPGLIEARDDVRHDETCSARYQQHGCRDPAFRAHHCPTPSGGATRGQPQ